MSIRLRYPAARVDTELVIRLGRLPACRRIGYHFGQRVDLGISERVNPPSCQVAAKNLIEEIESSGHGSGIVSN